MAYPFQLPDLDYAHDALEPHIDARTMEIHHGKHHAAYTANLNAALAAHPGLHGKSAHELVADLSAIPEGIRAAVRNNGGGYVNHAMFWQLMTPGGAGEPTGALASAIDAAFGSLGEFKDRFAAAAVGRFGSGWAWLTADGAGSLEVVSTPNQDTPVMAGKTPILGVDVWEHAYYLNYQNRRPDYVAAFWNVVNWTVVGESYAAV
ncbi:MAG: superoxide dismutase [Gemmatimonadetes bacterium]|nr:superoxide dismutase [Gemmatimonadota bacterium]MCY3610102.1 superoxide dismutase [Gemmatimonadota bacterium]MCY3676075.1 superoxide dismutase [Gemmatimonadota bacterium]MYA42261.1 superoxide dismutase [Gemmatimonadota bacterium]MYE94131.1 superoxide dismutase [Gemmatimonadota bacterium]